MKTIIASIIVAFSVMACNNANKEAATAQARQAVLDSIENVDRQKAIQQRTIDSMNQLAEQQKVEARRRAETSEPVAAEGSTKKKMNNTKKGALIGAGAGAVTGAVTGAVVSKDKGKGAVIGGLIGAAAGAGIGAGTGKAVDKKKEKEAEKK